MKLLFNLTILLFISASAFLFFAPDDGILLSSTPTSSSPSAGSGQPIKQPTGKKRGLIEARGITASRFFAPPPAAPFVTAQKTVDKATGAAGDLLTYTVVISNSGTVDAQGLSFSDDIDVNTTLVSGSVKTSPVPLNDSYTSLGNVGISVPAANGVLANDYLGTNPQASFTAVTNQTTTGGGTISIAADGSFTYTPAAGYTGNDTYIYSLNNGVATGTATITIAVSTVVWFINNNYSGTVADGRLATPFKTIADFQAVNDGTGLHPKGGQAIFVYESATAYTGNITLLDGQKLIGQDATTDLPTILGFTTPTYSSPALPALSSGNSTKVTLTATGATHVVALNGGASGTYTIRGLTIGDKGTGAGISGSSFGTLTVSEASITGAGQALSLSTGTLNATFADVSSSSGVNGIALTSIGGTTTISAGALSGHSGAAFFMNGGAGSLTYNGTLSKITSGNIITIQNKTGGTVDFNGAVTASTSSGGISLTTNTGTTISFDGGLNLSTSTNAAFTATGGGTVTATQDNNTIINQITTTSGTAVNVANTTIGAGGLTFRSINVNGASKGIILNTTGSGAFSITGTGTTAGSGGTIQNISVRGVEITSAQNISLSYLNLTNANTTDGGGAGVCDETNNDGCNAALYMKNVTTASLTSLNITTTEEQGMNFNNVSGLTITGATVQANGNDVEEGALKARNLLGNCTISSSTFKNSAYRIAHIINTTGTAHLAVSNSSFINEASNTSVIKQDCFEMRTQSTAQATVVITGSTFKRAGTKGIQIAAEGSSIINLGITGSTVDREGTPMAGVEVIADNTATVNANVDNNLKIYGAKEVSLNAVSFSTATLQATARSNSDIRGGNDPNLSAFATLRGNASQGSNAKVLFTNNVISQTDEEGILMASGSGTSGGSISGEVSGNTITTGNAGGNLTPNVIDVRSAPISGTGNTTCAYVRNNALTITANDGVSPRSFVITTGSATGSISLQGVGSTATDIWNNNGNTSTPVNFIKVNQFPGSTINYGGATNCPTPTNLTVPTSIVAADVEVQTAPAITSRAAVGAEESSPAERLESYGLANDQPAEEAPAVETTPTAETTPAADALQQKTAVALTAPVGGNVSVSGITLQPSQSLTIQFQATVNDPFPDNVCQVSNQGSVSGTNFATLLTDNDNNAGNGVNATVTAINTPPSIISCQDNINTTNDAGQCTASESFDVSVKGCPAPTKTFKIGGTTITSPYNFPIGVTTVDVTVSNGVGTDATCQFTVEVTNPAPAVSSVSVPANGTYIAGQNLDFTVNFSEAVTVNTAGGTPRLALTIGSQTRYANYVSGSGTAALVFRYTVASGDEDANGITVGALSANGGTLRNTCGTDANLTLNSVGSTTGVLVDAVVPTVTINQAAGQADPTTASPINFTVVFSEPVNGFTDADVTLSGTAGATTAVVTQIAPNNGSSYNVAVSGMTVDGTVIASIPANAAIDGAGNGNTASTSTDNTVTFVVDAPPSILSIDRYSPSGAQTNATSVTFRATFSEDVTGVDASDFSLALSGVTATLGTVTTVNGSTYDISVGSISGNGTLGLNLKASGTGIQDAINQDITGGLTGQTYTIDQIVPTVVSSVRKTPLTASTNATSVTYTVTFSENVIGVDATDFALTATETVAGSIGTVSGSGATYDVEVNSITSDGTLRLDVKASGTGITDDATNALSGGFTSGETYTFDHTAPTVLSINRYNPSTQGTTATTLVWRVTFSEEVSGVDINDFALATTGTASGTISSVSASAGTIIDVTVTGVSGTGGNTIGLNLKTSGTGIVDAVGNAISGGFTGQTYTIGIPPTFTSCPESKTSNTDAGQCSATVSRATLLTGATATGTPDPTYTVKVGSTVVTSSYTFPKGNTTVDITASNGVSPDAVCSYTLTVIDNQKPVITGVSVDKPALWPPNHRMQVVTVNYTATDNCTNPVTTTLSVTSNEPVNGTADGDTDPDWIVDNNHQVQLRAERANNSTGRIYTITITATDADNNSTTSTVTVTVAHNITAPVSGASFKIGSTVPFAGTFWDKPGNKHTAQWLIDGSTAVKGTVTEPSGNKNGKVTGSYKFTTAGVYKLQMNVTDQNKVTSYVNTNEDMEAIVVIYDPNGGYTYGGGYFASPQWALTSNPTATGKVSYGFAVNYFKTSTYPKGETQFDFKVGDLEYNALNFDYLSISGARAQFKGSGKIIGGQSGINFIMTAIDGQLDGTGVDKVRIKIYNKNTGQVYYDNEPGTSEADNPKTAVALGSQVVIGGAAVQTGAVVTKTESLQEASNLEVRVLPNPTTQHSMVFVQSSNKQDRIVLQVFDQWGRRIEQRVVSGEYTRIGASYRPGTYFIRVVQGDQHREAKLLKMRY